MPRRRLMHSVATRWTNPQGRLRIITRCGSDLPLGSRRYTQQHNLRRLRDAGHRVCDVCARD